jgi:osmotically-inducible protein OsmY
VKARPRPLSARDLLRAAATGLLVALTLAAPGVAGPAATPADEELRGQLESQLETLRDRESAEIRVVVREGLVILQGRVGLLEQSLRAEQIAWKTPGVLDVDNELRIVPLAVTGDAEIERRARTLIKGDARFIDTSLEVEVRAGVVRLRGSFQDPADVLALKHRIAAIPGVLDVAIDAVLVARGPSPDIAPRT